MSTISQLKKKIWKRHANNIFWDHVINKVWIVGSWVKITNVNII